MHDTAPASDPPQVQSDEEIPLLAARGLGFSAGGQQLIYNINLDIRPGSRTVIMGANGTGKSLLLRLLHGLITPTEGHVEWCGRPLDKAARNEQAMVFQRPVMMRRSVAANLRFALAARGIRGAERAAREAEAIASARLEHLVNRPARVLSGGEQQRLAVARALACAPRLLFLDEPTASLDPASTHAIEQIIDNAHENGVTIVLVTHNVGQAQRMGKDLIFLDAGQVVETGPVAQVLDAPKSAAAQAWLGGRLFLDTSPQNNT